MRVTLAHIAIIPAFIFFAAASGCTKEKNTDEIYVISGEADSHEINPSANTDAIGTLSGIYSVVDRKIAFNICWNNLGSEATVPCFYTEPTLTGYAMMKKLPLTEPGKKGLCASQLYLTEEEAKSLENGEWYFTVCTVDHKDGEIRGKISVSKNQ